MNSPLSTMEMEMERMGAVLLVQSDVGLDSRARLSLTSACSTQCLLSRSHFWLVVCALWDIPDRSRRSTGGRSW